MLLLDVDDPIVHEVQQHLHVPRCGVPEHNDRVFIVGAVDSFEYLSEPVTAGGQDQSMALQGLLTTLQGHVLQVAAVKQPSKTRTDALLEVIPF